MYKVQKRDGSTVEFDLSKISAAMVKAFDAVGKQHHPSVINILALQVSAKKMWCWRLPKSCNARSTA